jgi:hypothetical protein
MQTPTEFWVPHPPPPALLSAPPRQSGREFFRTTQGQWASPSDRADITSAAFLRGGWLVTGATGGRLLQWDASDARGCLGRCVRVRASPPLAALCAHCGTHGWPPRWRGPPILPHPVFPRTTGHQRARPSTAAVPGVDGPQRLTSGRLSATDLLPGSGHTGGCSSAGMPLQGTPHPPATQAVRALALRAGGCELVSAGDDGRLIVWDAAGEAGLGRVVADLRVGPRKGGGGGGRTCLPSGCRGPITRLSRADRLACRLTQAVPRLSLLPSLSV